jgi:hypothetical protein
MSLKCSQLFQINILTPKYVKRPVNKMDMDRFNLNKLNEGEVKEQCQVTTKNRFEALENLRG